jgi:hypothetical protein
MLGREKTDKLTSAELFLVVALPTWFISYGASMVFIVICENRDLMMFKLKRKVNDNLLLFIIINKLKCILHIFDLSVTD